MVKDSINLSVKLSVPGNSMFLVGASTILRQIADDLEASPGISPMSGGFKTMDGKEAYWAIDRHIDTDSNETLNIYTKGVDIG